jgi:hypothetical protein
VLLLSSKKKTKKRASSIQLVFISTPPTLSHEKNHHLHFSILKKNATARVRISPHTGTAQDITLQRARVIKVNARTGS